MPDSVTVAAVLDAREALERIDRSDLSDRKGSRIMNALEIVDDLFLNFDRDDLAEIPTRRPDPAPEQTVVPEPVDQEPSAEQWRAEEPPEYVEWIGPDLGVLEIEFSRPILEWMEIEAEEYGFAGAHKWARTQLWMQLLTNLEEKHGFEHDVEVDVPEDFARRASCWIADQRLDGGFEKSDFEAFMYNNIEHSPHWKYQGDPWPYCLFVEDGDDE